MTARRRAAVAAAMPALLLAGGCGSSAAGQETPTAEELVPALGEPAGADDALPTVEGEAAPSDIAAGSARHLGSSGDGEVWVALEEDGDVCLVLELPVDETVAASCGTAEELAEHGTWVGGAGPETSGRALLLPEGLDLDDTTTAHDDWVVVADNLAVPAEDAP